MSATATEPQQAYGAERAKAFVDAVVAIAMTLLILPLMESVTEVAGEGGGARDWLAGHDSQIFSFVLSFVIIAMLWMNHHHLFAVVEQITAPLLWLLAAWMLSIVWLPVATALTGQMPDTDGTAKTLYIGSMITTSLISLATRVFLLRHPSLHTAGDQVIRRGLTVDLTMAGLFTLSLVVALLLLPSIGYLALFLMMLTGPVRRVVARVLGV